MQYTAVLCAASGMIALIREEYWLGAVIAVLAVGCIVLCFVLHRKKKRSEAMTNAILDIRAKREDPANGSRDYAFDMFAGNSAKPKKKPKPDPDCPICHRQGLKSGNFTGDLVNCDCMEEDE